MTTLVGVVSLAGDDPALMSSCVALGWSVAVAPDLAAAWPALISSDVTWVVLVRDRGRVLPAAMEVLERLDAESSTATVVFGDSEIGGRGAAELVRRPVHSPERLRCQYFWGEFVAYRRDLLLELGAPDSEVNGAGIYDLALRATRAGAEVVHAGAPLFHRSGSVAPLIDAELRATRVALQRHLDATGGGEVVAVGADGVHDTRRPVRGEPLVSIIIPTRGVVSVVDGAPRCYVLDALRSIVELSTYQNFEVVLVIDENWDPAVLFEAEDLLGPKLVTVPFYGEFNFSAKINSGALRSHGEHLLLLNDDVTIIDPGWIEALLALSQLPGSGMAGAALFYEDGSMQHAGHAYWEGDASHIGLDALPDDPGPLDGYRVEREVAGVTAACAIVPRHVFFEVGGLTRLLPGNFNDVDFCMKVTWRGHPIYWTPHARLFHYESKTRDASVHGFEVDVAWKRWAFRMHAPEYWPYPLTRPPQSGDRRAW